MKLPILKVLIAFFLFVSLTLVSDDRGPGKSCQTADAFTATCELLPPHDNLRPLISDYYHAPRHPPPRPPQSESFTAGALIHSKTVHRNRPIRNYEVNVVSKSLPSARLVFVISNPYLPPAASLQEVANFCENIPSYGPATALSAQS